MLEDARVIGLLGQADEACAAQAVAVDVVRCRQVAARRLASRRIGACTFTGLLAVAGCWLALRGDSSPQTARHDRQLPVAQASLAAPDAGLVPTADPEHQVTDGVDSASLAQTFEEVRSQAEMIEQTLQLYRRRQRLQSQRSRLAQLEAQPPVPVRLRLQEEINLTAALALDYAERLASEAGDPLHAAAEYRRLARRYPGTRWAAQAEHALAQFSVSAN